MKLNAEIIITVPVVVPPMGSARSGPDWRLFFQQFYDTCGCISARVGGGAGPQARKAFVDLAMELWRSCADTDGVVPFERPDSLAATINWTNSDFVLNFQGTSLTFGVDYSRTDNTFSTSADQLRIQLNTMLGQQVKLLQGIINLSEIDKHRLPRLAIAIESKPDDDGDRTDVVDQWATSKFAELFMESLHAPAKFGQHQNGQSFLWSVTSPEGDRGPLLPWSFKAHHPETLWVAANGGPRVLPSNIDVHYLLWLKAGSLDGELLPSGRAYTPNYREVVFGHAFDAASADAIRVRIHEELAESESDVASLDAKAMHTSEHFIAEARRLAANVLRWRNNTRLALMSLGVLRSRAGEATQDNDLISYMDELATEIDIEAERFEPEIRRAAEAVDRQGGLLGWPGVLFASTALVLSTFETWWAIVGSGVTPDASRKTELKMFAVVSVWAVTLCCALTGITLGVLGVSGFIRHRQIASLAGYSRLKASAIAISTFNVWSLLVAAVVVFVMASFCLVMGIRQI